MVLQVMTYFSGEIALTGYVFPKQECIYCIEWRSRLSFFLEGNLKTFLNRKSHVRVNYCRHHVFSILSFPYIDTFEAGNVLPDLLQGPIIRCEIRSPECVHISLVPWLFLRCAIGTFSSLEAVILDQPGSIASYLCLDIYWLMKI